MRTQPLVGAALACLAAAIASAPVHAESPERDGCVVYSEVSHHEEQTLDVHLSNTCSKPMACSVGWTVKCGKASKVTHEGAVLGGSVEKTWVASAESCSEDWSIDTTWSCRPGR
jgi:hypothetical protein